LVARQVAEEEGEYTPAEEGGYTPAEEGGYTPAEEGGYTPAEEGGYTPAEEGGYTPAEEGGDVDQWPESQQSDGGGAGGAPPGTITNLPGTDYDSCVEQTEEDTARLVDTINTACSVKGAAFAVGGGAAGAFLGPIGAGIGAVAGGIYGAYNYGKCVEEQNAMARAGAKKQKAQCAEKFKH
jgi:hypothetical protein